MFKLFVLAALVAIASAAPQPAVIGAPLVTPYTAPVVAASPLPYSGIAAPLAYSGYGFGATPLAYSAGYRSGYVSPYSTFGAIPHLY